MRNYKRISPKIIFTNKKFQKFIIGFLTFMILFLTCSICIIPKKYDLKEGDIAPSDIKAPRDFRDEMATKSKIDRAILNIQPQYNKNVDIQKEAVNKIDEYVNKVKEIKGLGIEDREKVEKLASEGNIKLTMDDYSESLKLNNNDLNEFQDFMKGALSKIYSLNIRENNEEDIKKAQDDWNFYIRNSNMTKTVKELAVNMGIDLIRPNNFYDYDRTEYLKSIVKKQVEPTIIKRNQNIILKGEVVTNKHIYLMQQAGLLHNNGKADMMIYIGLGFIVFMVIMLICIYLYRYKENILYNNSKLTMLAIIFCLNIGLTAAINTISGYLIPTAFAVMLINLIFDPMVAIIMGISSTILVGCVTSFSFEVIILYILGCVTGILFSNNVYQRNNVFKGGVLIGVVNSIVIFAVGLINNIWIMTNSINALYGIIGGILSSILAIGVLPIFEQMFDIITPIKLLELSNPNQPLIKKLLFEAPGTYHHSILVGNLAETAADEIGASPLLARVGAYYHDIGKTKRPYFFKENQVTNDNPHDKITPKLSTLIITSHVKDGVEIARDYKLPGAIRKIIEEHHGTTLVKYFYAMAVNDGKEVVEENTFRYEGPKPSSKESAIVMLADSTEAAVRSMNSPTIEDIQRMISKIIDEKVADGQLDECDLTLKDIEKIKKSFNNVLVGITHSRIEYPEIRDNNIQIKEVDVK